MNLVFLTDTYTEQQAQDLKETVIRRLKGDYRRNDVFESVRVFILEFVRSSIGLSVTIALMVLSIGFIIAAMRFVGGDAKERGEAKTKMITILIVLAVISALSAITMFIIRQADGITYFRR